SLAPLDPDPPQRARASAAGRRLDALSPVGALAAGVAAAGLLFVLPGWARVLVAALAVGWAAWLNTPPKRVG
ncbi:MAG: hypothetical protein KC613_12970, partial [Myxococcales bacterium]|nr:hypothetical protein [Myxococcales bacterium]